MIPQQYSGTFNLVQIYDVKTEGKFSLAVCLRWNGMCAQTLNKEEGVLVGDGGKSEFASYS